MGLPTWLAWVVVLELVRDGVGVISRRKLG